MPINAMRLRQIEGRRRNGPARFLSLGNRRVRSERWHVEEGKTKRHGVKHDASVSKEVLKQSATGSYRDRESRNYDF